MISAERDPLDDPFYGLGYTKPEAAIREHVRKLIPGQRHSPETKFHLTGHVREYASDRDYDVLPSFVELSDEQRAINRRGAAKARAELAIALGRTERE